ncbi:MAG: serine/threonine protein kinase [Planctomycetes bacterium]|nr:serine/threonine protein kinase [Planctomycetota bacterium]
MGFFDKIKQLFAANPDSGRSIIDVNKRFELIGRTGQGSMSKVWRARDRESGRTVCLKVLDREKTQKFEARFFGLKKPSEGEICLLLRHDNIVQTFEHGLTTEKEPYIVMELVDGVGLNFLIETKHKDLQGNRVNYLSQYALGIEFMHKTGFLHRDICPRNVMVNKEGVVKIIDLGLAIPYTPDFCKPGNRTGTTMYLAPELIKRSTTDHRVDMFALGVTAFEMFVGDFPWEKGSSQEVLRAIVNQPPRNPRDFRADLPEDVVDFLMKAVDRDPNRRFQNPLEFRTALANLKGSW